MKISHSIVSDKSLDEFIVENYEISRASECKYLYQGLNDFYLVNDGKEKYIFRIYRSGWRSRENIVVEVELLSQLEKNSAPVAGIIQDRRGEKVQTIRCPEGERYGILMHCAANSENESHCIVEGNALGYGKAVAKLHNAARNCDIPAGTTLIDAEHLIWQPLALVESVFPDRKQELEYLNGFARQIASKLASVENCSVAMGLIHGDLTGGNASVDAQGNFVFFDFDCCGYGWIAYDWAVLLWSALLHGKENVVWSEFFDGYRSEASIDEADLAIVPLLVAARNFWIMGYSISQIPLKGTLSYKIRDLMRDVEFFKNWRNELPS